MNVWTLYIYIIFIIVYLNLFVLVCSLKDPQYFFNIWLQCISVIQYGLLNCILSYMIT